MIESIRAEEPKNCRCGQRQLQLCDFRDVAGMQLWQVPVMCSNRSVPHSFQFSPPWFERPRGPQISSPRHKAKLSLLGHSAGSIGSPSRSVHLRCCCPTRFLFAKSVNRSLRSLPGSFVRGRARFCKHLIVLLCRLQKRKP